MRTREDIEKELNITAERIDIGAANLYLMEVLLDIRDILIKNYEH